MEAAKGVACVSDWFKRFHCVLATLVSFLSVEQQTKDALLVTRLLLSRRDWTFRRAADAKRRAKQKRNQSSHKFRPLLQALLIDPVKECRQRIVLFFILTERCLLCLPLLPDEPNRLTVFINDISLFRLMSFCAIFSSYQDTFRVVSFLLKNAIEFSIWDSSCRRVVVLSRPHPNWRMQLIK